MLSIIISMYVCMYALLIMYILHSHTHKVLEIRIRYFSTATHLGT